MRRAFRIALLAAFVAALLSLSGCADPQAAQRERLDDAIHDVESAIGRYYSVDQQGPVSDLERVTERVVSAWETAAAEAVGLDDIDTSAAQSALDALVQATSELDEGLSARDGLTVLEPYIEAFDYEVEEIHDALDLH